MKKGLLVLFGLLMCISLYSQELILLKTFKINGKEEIKKVKIIGKEEYTYSGNPKIISQHGKVKEIFFYDENGNLIQKEDEQGIYKYEYNSKNQIIHEIFPDNWVVSPPKIVPLEWRVFLPLN